MVDFTRLIRSLTIFFTASIITIQVTAQSRVHRTEPWITDSGVSRVEHSNGYTMLSGGFSSIGVYTGGFVRTDATTGVANDSAMPKVDGDIYAVISDGQQGWYISGYFNYVDTVRIQNLAHIKADKTVDRTWKPNPDGAPSAMLLNGTTLYTGGYFSSVAGQTRNNGAAFNTTNGTLLAWNPNTNNSINTLAASGTSIYIGGYFTNIGGFARSYLAAVDQTTGVPTAWAPVINGAVLTLAVDATSIFVGGSFTTVGAAPRAGLARLSLTAPATLQTFNASLTASSYVEDMLINGNILYISGNFTTVGAAARVAIASVTITTSLATSWNPVLPASSYVQDIELRGTSLYFVGNFASVNATTRDASAAVDATTGVLLSWDPHANSAPFCIFATDAGVFIGGYFTGTNWTARASGFALLNDATDKPWPFDFDLNGGTVNTIAVKDNVLYIGGQFSAINKTARQNLAAFNLTTGALLPWNPVVFGESPTDRNVYVSSMKIKDNLLYFGGKFLAVNTAATIRPGLAAVDLSTAVVNGWNPLVGDGKTTNQYINSIDIFDKTVYAAGLFNLIGLSNARGNIAAIDASSGAILKWNPDSKGEVSKIVVTSTRAYVVGEFFNGVGGKVRFNRIASLVLNADTAANFNPNLNSSAYDVALSGSEVYVAGYFDSEGSRFRPGLASFSLANDSLTTWVPDIGGNGDGGYDVRSVSISPCNKIYLGGNIVSFGTEGRENYGEYVLTPTPPDISLVDGTTLTTTSAGTLQWYKNGVAVNGATKSTLEVDDPYEYSTFYVTATIGGCTARSADQEYLITLSELSTTNQVQVFPNPVQSDLFIQTPISTDKIGFTMIDMTGRTIKRYDGNGTQNILHLNDVEPGSYILIIKTGKLNQTRKIIKIK